MSRSIFPARACRTTWRSREHYSLLMDLPLFWDPQLLERKVHKVTYYPELPSRFGIMPRYGTNADVRWFEASPCYIYHVVNAWEDGDEFVMEACRVIQAEPGAKRGEGELARMRAFLRLEAQLCRWRFNLVTRRGHRRAARRRKDRMADDQPPDDGPQVALCVQLDGAALRRAGEIRHAVRGTSEKYLFGAGRTSNEAPFAPRVGARDEDDGYVVTFVADSNAMHSSEVIILDAKNFAAGPIARVQIPQRVPVGFHSTWIPGDQLRLAAAIDSAKVRSPSHSQCSLRCCAAALPCRGRSYECRR